MDSVAVAVSSLGTVTFGQFGIWGHVHTFGHSHTWTFAHLDIRTLPPCNQNIELRSSHA